MHINNSEALKSWLIVVLEPMCDADSSALARYVLALLKKDKVEVDLKKVMNEQLDVFLGEETEPFVERLFHAINTEEYLKPAAVSVPKKKIETHPTVTVNLTETDAKKIDDQREQNTAIELKQGNAPSTSSGSISRTHVTPSEENKTKEVQSNHKSSENMDRSASHHTSRPSDSSNATVPTNSGNHLIRSASPPIRVNADKENQPRDSRRRRTSLRSRSRSRSRSNERPSRRSRSRDRRINEREKNRQFRNKSPPGPDSRHDKRRGGGGSDRRRTGDDRSPRFGASSGESRKTRNNRSNSRSRSPSSDRIKNKTSPCNRNIRGSPDRHHHHAQVENEKRQRCRDFDEKGYCVRGETCPWDHGINPVVFESLNNPSLLSMSLREYNPDVPDLWNRSAAPPPPGNLVGTNPNPLASGGGVPAPSINPFTGAARPGGVMVGGGAGVNFPHVPPNMDKTANGSGGLPADYIRNAAAGPAFRPGAPLLGFPFNPSVATPLQRELIPIPVVDASGGAGGDVGAMQQGKRRFDLEDTVAIAEGPPKRKVPINSRLGPRVQSVQNNCSLELRKVPRGLNTIAHLNNHFAKFGKIVNIQISYDGDPEAAIVTFSTHAEANVAYRSTEAVLNNRFIKVFWHSSDTNSGGDSGNIPINTGRKNSQYHLNNIPAIPTPTADSAKTSNPATASQLNASTSANISTNATTPVSVDSVSSNNAPIIATTASLRLKNNAPRSGATNAIIRKKQEEQAKAVVQLANGLRKRKQELLQSYVKQMKSALELVERCESTDPQRSKTLETIKELQEKIDKLRKEIAAEQEQMQAQIQNQQPMPPKKTKEQQKKELLDIELELFAQQQEGNDTTAIQKRLEELQRSLGITPGSGHAGQPLSGGVNKSGPFQTNRMNPRIRATYPEGSTRVDRRPKTIVVTGFASDEADFVLGHFKHFGEIAKHDVDKEIPQLILSYATRINAEQAVLRGKFFKDKRLQISWAPSAQAPQAITQLGDGNKANVTGSPKTIVKSSSASDAASIESDLTPDILPELRLEDEEDDDESEDRSWRR